MKSLISSSSSSSSFISSILSVVILIIIITITPFVNVSYASQIIFKVNQREVPSIKYLIQNYGFFWHLDEDSNTLTILNLLGFIIEMNPDGHLIRLRTTQQYTTTLVTDNGPPDPNFEYYDFPYLEELLIGVTPRDGSKNIFELTKGMTSLKDLTIINHNIDYIPEDFPYNDILEDLSFLDSQVWIHPKNINSLKYPSLIHYMIPSQIKEPIPDGVGDGIVGFMVQYAIPNTYYKYVTRIPDSLCSALLFDVSSLRNGMFSDYVADCFKCFNHQFVNLPFTIPHQYPMDCNITVSSLHYLSTGTVIIEGNNLLNAVQERDWYGNPLPFITPDGEVYAKIPNKKLVYGRYHLSKIEEDVVIGNNTANGYIASVPISFTTINLQGGLVSSQLPWGLYISVPINYNSFIDHKIIVNGVPCLKHTIIYSDDQKLQCFVPILVSEAEQYLTLNIHNRKNSATTYFNLKRKYPNITNQLVFNITDIYNNFNINNNNNINNSTQPININNNNVNNSNQLYNINNNNNNNFTLIILNGVFSYDYHEIPTNSIVQINNQPCNIQSLNYTTLQCTINLLQISDQLATQPNSTNLQQQLDLYVEIDGHSFTSSNVIYLIKSPSNNTSNTSAANRNRYGKELAIYLTITTVGAIPLVILIVYLTKRIFKQNNNSHYEYFTQMVCSNASIKLLKRKGSHQHVH